MELTENSLSFFTLNHTKHDSQWRMTGRDVTLVCVACLVEILESPNVLHLRKRKALQEIVFLLSNNQNLLELLCRNTRIVSHLCNTVMDMLSLENELLMSTAAEALDIITVKLRSEKLVEKVMETLENQVLRLNNFKKSYPFVLALGRLFKSIPDLCQVFAKNSSSLLEYLISNIVFPEESIKVAFLFVLAQVCSNEEALKELNFQIREKIYRQTCAVINCSVSLDTQVNALGVLKLFATQPDVIISVLKLPIEGKCDELESLKKLMLSQNEAIQTGAIQFITQILRNDREEKYFTGAILRSGIGEMLLEDLECSNDMIVASVFCCLDHIVRAEVFFTEGYSVYGIESVIIGVSKAIKFKNPEIIKQAIRVLSLILSLQSSNVQLFPNEELYRKCADVLHQSLKSADHRVTTQAASAVVPFLNINHFPSLMSFDAVVPLVLTVISQVEKFMKPREHFRNIPKGAFEALLGALWEVIKKALQFVQEFRTGKPSYATLLTRNESTIANENERLEQFLDSLWKAIDQTCVPALMLNYESIECPAVFENFFEILSLSVSSLNTYRDVFAKKLASSSFVRLSLEIRDKFCRSPGIKELKDVSAHFLTDLCLALADCCDTTQLKEVIQISNIAGIHSLNTCLNLLTQCSVRQSATTEITDIFLFNSQCACIELIYVALAHGDKMVSTGNLATSLHKYIMLLSDVSILPRVTQKHLLYLWIASYSRLSTLTLSANVMESMEVAQKIIEQHLMNLTPNEFESIHIHEVLFLSWIFSREPLARALGRQALIFFLTNEETKNCSTDEELQQLLTTNDRCFQAFVSLVDHDMEAIVSRVGIIVEALMSEKSKSSPTKLSAPHLNSKAIQLTSIFHKIFLSHKYHPLKDHCIFAMLKVMTAVQMHINLAFDVKFLYHVINLLTSSDDGQRFAVCAINYLNVLLAWDMNRENHRVAAVLLSNKPFYSFVEHIVNAKLVNSPQPRRDSVKDVKLLASTLVLISSLAVSQTLPQQSARHVFILGKKCMISLANEGQNILRLSAVVFWDALFKTSRELENPVLVLTNGNEPSLVKLSEEDHLVLLVYLQNSLIHDSETVRQCAVKCLTSFLSYVPNASDFACNPWNRIVFESQLCVLSVNVLTPSLLLFCLLVLQYAPSKNFLDDVLQDAVKSILCKIPSIPCSDQDQSWHCVKFLAQVLSDKDIVTSENQKCALLNWLTALKETVMGNEKRSSSNEPLSTETEHSDEREVRFYKIDDVIFSKALLKPPAVLDNDLLKEVFLLLNSKGNEKDDTTN
ncbi:meiosis inhibitor protein 1-like [Stylophora pistillata]|uniref:Meiosis inhibitor protein 1 n=1 Tax=Stylophora pistillata TaxID=50429 RepID=A0A2B4SA75_STYPI|nr:meiosis inhibitor protein 1-like [Stylophora pistillata]PFX25933.1 Meiosis inhibitor protein 1 [Stylophora pistillata]